VVAYSEIVGLNNAIEMKAANKLDPILLKSECKIQY
jgi:hypothetical protein